MGSLAGLFLGLEVGGEAFLGGVFVFMALRLVDESMVRRGWIGERSGDGEIEMMRVQVIRAMAEGWLAAMAMLSIAAGLFVHL